MTINRTVILCLLVITWLVLGGKHYYYTVYPADEKIITLFTYYALVVVVVFAFDMSNNFNIKFVYFSYRRYRQLFLFFTQISTQNERSLYVYIVVHFNHSNLNKGGLFLLFYFREPFKVYCLFFVFILASRCTQPLGSYYHPVLKFFNLKKKQTKTV